MVRIITSPNRRIGSIYLKSNKIFCAIAYEKTSKHSITDNNLPEIEIEKFISFDVEGIDYETNLREACDFMRSEKALDAVSVGSFGPFSSLDPYAYEAFGMISADQPQGFLEHFDIEKVVFGDKKIEERLVKRYINTDVNCCAVGEFFRRANAHAHPLPAISTYARDNNKHNYAFASTLLVYIIVGAGIGAGFTWGGYRVRDRMHPEMGHLPVAKLSDDVIESCCRHHGKRGPCIEGLASDDAHRMRLLESRSAEFSNDLRARYLAHMIHGIALTLAPSCVVIDMVHLPEGDAGRFVDRIRQAYKDLSCGYPGYQEMGTDNFISTPIAGVGAKAPQSGLPIPVGVEGSLIMATSAFSTSTQRSIRVGKGI